MPVKRERISALFDHQGFSSRGSVFFVQNPGLGAGHADGRLSRKQIVHKLKCATRGADAELRTLCRRGVIPA